MLIRSRLWDGMGRGWEEKNGVESTYLRSPWYDWWRLRCRFGLLLFYAASPLRIVESFFFFFWPNVAAGIYKWVHSAIQIMLRYPYIPIEDWLPELCCVGSGERGKCENWVIAYGVLNIQPSTIQLGVIIPHMYVCIFLISTSVLRLIR